VGHLASRLFFAALLASAGCASAAASSARAPSASTDSLAAPADWTNYSHAGLGVSFAYPSKIFRLSETPESITLLSDLARETDADPQPNESHPPKFAWSLHVTAYSKSAKDAVKELLPSYFDSAFPKGQFDEKNGSVVKTTLAGLDGYRVGRGIEGYDSAIYVLARTPTSALVFEFDTVGNDMRPNPPEEQQKKIFDALRSSLRVGA
jgi:hypothetical protein